MLDMRTEQIEAGLKHLADSHDLDIRDIVEGLCGMMRAQKTLPIALVRPVLERRELGGIELAEISLKFFEVSAQYLFPGIPCREDHFAHSFLAVALMAKSFEMCAERAIAQGWSELSFLVHGRHSLAADQSG